MDFSFCTLDEELSMARKQSQLLYTSTIHNQNLTLMREGNKIVTLLTIAYPDGTTSSVSSIIVDPSHQSEPITHAKRQG